MLLTVLLLTVCPRFENRIASKPVHLLSNVFFVARFLYEGHHQKFALVVAQIAIASLAPHHTSSFSPFLFGENCGFSNFTRLTFRVHRCSMRQQIPCANCTNAGLHVPSKYKCPACGVVSCSLHCVKAHKSLSVSLNSYS